MSRDNDKRNDLCFYGNQCYHWNENVMFDDADYYRNIHFFYRKNTIIWAAIFIKWESYCTIFNVNNYSVDVFYSPNH